MRKLRPMPQDRVRFYSGDLESVLTKKQQGEAQALLERFASGERDAFSRFRSMFERTERSPELDALVDGMVRSYRAIAGRRLRPGELANMRELSEFQVYYKVGRMDANAAAAAFTVMEARGRRAGAVPHRS